MFLQRVEEADTAPGGCKCNEEARPSDKPRQRVLHSSTQDSGGHILAACTAVLLPLVNNAAALSPQVMAAFIVSLAFAAAPRVLGHRGTSRAFCAVIPLTTALHLLIAFATSRETMVSRLESLRVGGTSNLVCFAAVVGLWLGSRPASHVPFKLRLLTASVNVMLRLTMLNHMRNVVGAERVHEFGIIASGTLLVPFVAAYVLAELVNHLRAPASQWLSQRWCARVWCTQADRVGSSGFLINCALVAFFSFSTTLLLATWAKDEAWLGHVSTPIAERFG